MYTILMIGINISGRTATNLLLPGELETLTPDDIELRIYGSKIVILLEQAMLIVTWGIKGCMILMYHRLTSRLTMQIVIKAIAVYIVIGFVAVELAWFLSCRPFKGYWMLPVPMGKFICFFRLVLEYLFLAVVWWSFELVHSPKHFCTFFPFVRLSQYPLPSIIGPQRKLKTC